MPTNLEKQRVIQGVNGLMEEFKSYFDKIKKAMDCSSPLQEMFIKNLSKVLHSSEEFKK